MKYSLFIYCLFGLIVVSAPATAGTVSLSDYIDQVHAKNPDIHAADLGIEAMGQKVLELDMVYSPLLTGSYNRTDDRSGPGFGTTLAVDEMKADSVNVNASKKFSTGTNVSFGYAYFGAAFSLLSPLSFNGVNYPNFTGYQITPVLSVSQSILRDWGAGLTQSGINKAKSAVLAAQYQLFYREQQLLLGARSAYWDLALAREVLEFRKASLDRAEKLLQWNEKKIRLDLIEKSDLLQSQAAYKLRQLNLQLAQEDEVRACRVFNQMLGSKADAVEDDLEKISNQISAFTDIGQLSSTGKRADVLAAESSFKSSEYADKETKYRARPELSLNASYQLTGLGLSSSDAWDQITAQDKPTYIVGASLVVPLDFKTLSKVKKGYENDFSSAKEAFRSSEIAAQNDWDQLQVNWKNVKSRLSLSQEIMRIQDERVKNEQTKFERGRTTTFLILSAENDLDDATLTVYRTVLEEIMTLAQAELFNTQPLTNRQ
jgi:outer membrane protein